MQKPFIITVAVAVALGAAAAAAANTSRPLANGARSLDRLGHQFLDAVMAGDTAAMHELRVTEHEHNTLLWPEFPASRPEINMPVDFAWYNVDSRSRRDARRIVSDFGSRDLTFRGVTCVDGVTDFTSFRIHENCWVHVRSTNPGTLPETIKLFGSVVQMGGRFKVVGIVSD